MIQNPTKPLTQSERIYELERILSVERAKYSVANDAFNKKFESLKHLECPWPESIWPMTDEQYVAAIPDGAKRTAISGFLMRLGWNEAMRQINKAD